MLDKKKSKNRSIKLLRSNSQRSTIAKHLLLNGHITQWRAIERYHITRLSAHIFDLKHEFGLDHVNAKYIFSFSKVKKDTHTWEHNDGEHCIAGILYLNPEPVDSIMSGTRIAESNIENKFNRLVMYDGSQTHQQNGAWGDTWDECRLTMNMFIYDKDFIK